MMSSEKPGDPKLEANTVPGTVRDEQEVERTEMCHPCHGFNPLKPACGRLQQQPRLLGETDMLAEGYARRLISGPMVYSSSGCEWSSTPALDLRRRSTLKCFP